MSTRRKLVVGVLIVAAVGAVVGLVWFQPQKLFIDKRVDDELVSAQTVPTTAAPASTAATTTAPPQPIELSRTDFVDEGHPGSGTAVLVRLPDGRHVVQFENLAVENGPDLRVILSPAAAGSGRDAYDDGTFVDLGGLKGNQGNQVYEVPAGTDLAALKSVAIWCRRFNYTFNAANIGPA